MQQFDDEGSAVFFRTHLSDVMLLRDPSITLVRRNTIRAMMSADELEEMESASFDLERQASNADNAEVKQLTRQIFHAWDIGGEGFMTVEEITACSGLDEQFAVPLGRVLGRDSTDQTVSLQSLTRCIGVLKYGSIEDKVRLLFTFMDSDSNGRISYGEAKLCTAMVGDQGLEKLGFVDHSGGERSLAYEDLLLLFQNSARGDAAISIFCDQVLQLLDKRTLQKRPVSRYFPATPAAAITTVSDHTWEAMKEIVGNNASKESLFIYALALLQVMFWLIHFCYFKGQGLPLSYCIAKGFGLNLRVVNDAAHDGNAVHLRRAAGFHSDGVQHPGALVPRLQPAAALLRTHVWTHRIPRAARACRIRWAVQAEVPPAQQQLGGSGQR